MHRKRRIAAWVLTGVGIGLALVLTAVLLLTRTGAGVREAGGFAVGWLDDRIDGRLAVGRVTSRGGLLAGVTLHDVAIHDPAGRPFLDADSATLSYDWRSFLAGRIVFDGVALFRPRVVIEKLPGQEEWNYERVFASGAPQRPSSPDQDRLILLGGLRLVGGDVTVRMPYTEAEDPGETLEPEDTARILVEAFPGGLVRVMRFEDLDADLPRIIWESPLEEGKLIRIARLSTRAFVWEDPILVRRIEGAVTVRDSLVSFTFDPIELPESRADMLGRVILGDRVVMDIRLEASRVALADLRWISRDLPDEGSGSLRLRIQNLRGDVDRTLWLARDVDLTAPGTRIRGDLGIVTGDTVYFTAMDLHADPLDLGLFQALLPGDLDVAGLTIGSLEVQER